MTTEKQLGQYYNFDSDITDAVLEAGAMQDAMGLEGVRAHYDLDNNHDMNVQSENSQFAREELRLTPKGDYDPAVVDVAYLPYAVNMTPNMVYRFSRLHMAQGLLEDRAPREMRIYGNAGLGHRNATGRLSREDRKLMTGENTLAPVVDPTLQHLKRSKIGKIAILGASQGADVGATAAGRSPLYGIETEQAVLADSASNIRLSLPTLGISFAKAGNKLQHYVDETNSEPYSQIVSEEKWVGPEGYMTGVFRPTNIAIAKVLSRNGYKDRVRSAMQNNPNMRLADMWAADSEVGDRAVAQAIAETLTQEFGEDRVTGMEINGGHAIINQLDVHAAMMMQGLRETAAITTPIPMSRIKFSETK